MKDIKKIAQKLNKQFQFLKQAEIIFMFDNFQKKRPHLVIDQNEFRVRNIYNHFNTAFTDKVVITIQMKCFDSKINQTKCIEVFLVDGVKYGIEFIQKFVSLSQQMVRKDLILQVLDSYYLDDYEIFYVIEYEDFEHIGFQINTPTYQEEIENYIQEIYSYSIQSLLPYPSQEIKKELIYKCQFGLVKTDNSKRTLKLNVVDPYIFQSPQIQDQEDMKTPPLKLSNNQILSLDELQFGEDTIIPKNDLLKVIQINYPNLYEAHGEIIQYLTLKPLLRGFTLLNFDDKTLDLQAQTSDKNIQIRIRLIRFQSEEDAQVLIQKQEELSKLTSFYSLIQVCELVSLPTSKYVLTEAEQSGSQSYIPVVNMVVELVNKHQLGTLQIKQWFEKNEWNEERLRIFEIVEYLLENIQTLNEHHVDIDCLYLNQQTNKWYLYDPISVDKNSSVVSSFSNILKKYKHWVITLLYQLCIYFSNQVDKSMNSKSFKTLLGMVESHLSQTENYQSNSKPQSDWSNLKQSLTILKKIIIENGKLKGLIYKFHDSCVNSIQFVAPLHSLETDNIPDIIQFFKENNNITTIKIEMQAGLTFLSNQQQNEWGVNVHDLSLKLASNQHSLQILELNAPSTTKYEGLDYFGLQTKPFLQELSLTYYSQDDQRIIYLQLKNNQNRINSLLLNHKTIHNFGFRNQVQEKKIYLLYKLKRLVRLMYPYNKF